MSVQTSHTVDLTTLSAVQDRVLWLATSIIHHANTVRATPSGLKVGGHQASSASTVGIMTALYFHHLRGADRVSVKPHASPVLHAIEYLLGWLSCDHRILYGAEAAEFLSAIRAGLEQPSALLM